MLFAVAAERRSRGAGSAVLRACVRVRTRVHGLGRARSSGYYYFYYLNSVPHSVPRSVSRSVSRIGRAPFVYRLGGVSLIVSLPVSLPVSRFGAFSRLPGSPVAPVQKGRRQTGKRLAATRVPLPGPPLPQIRAPRCAPRIGLEISVLRAPIFAAVHPFPNPFGAVRGGSDAQRPVPVPAFRVRPSGCAPQHRGARWMKVARKI